MMLNNFSVLPWYASVEQQNARKWWVYGNVYPLYTPARYILPFQLILSHSDSHSISFIYLMDANTNSVVDGSMKTKLQNTGLVFKQFGALGYDVLVYPGQSAALTSLNNGRYYLMAQIDNHEYFSDVFTVVNDIQPYLKIEWWDLQDLVIDSGTIVYSSPSFKNVVYFPSDLGKPDYIFEEEGETRDGYFFPIKQISEKRFRFNFLAPEYLLDVMRFIRLSDFVRVSYRGQTYNADTFLITPEWDKNGDLAVVEAEFDTNTVAKKLGVGYLRGGDYNVDFNSDFNNQ